MVAGSGGQDEMKEFIDDAISKQEYRTAFKYVYSHPNYKLDRDQRISLLNNIDEIIPLGYSVDRFYENLKNDGALKSYGVMDANYPVIDANVKDFELIFQQNPMALADACDLPPEAFSWMTELGKTESAYAKVDLMANIIGLLCTGGLGLVGKLAGLDDVAALGCASAVSGLIAGIESNPNFQKTISSYIEESAIKAMQILSPEEYDHEVQRQAGVFLVAYLVGSPIVSCNLYPTYKSASKRVYYYNDAPRIDVRDKAEGSITSASYADSQGLDMNGLCRLAVTAMTPAAVDAINGKPVRISKFVRMLFALMFQKLADPSICQILPEQFPQRLLPTLALYGFVQAVLVLKESSSALGAATTKLKTGAGIGDMVEAIEYYLKSPHPALNRQRLKEGVEDHKFNTKLAPSRILAMIIRARELSRDIHQDEEIELIPGTSRMYTKEELVLPPQPSEWEIREVAKQVMNNKYKSDMSKLGRISSTTREEVSLLSQQLTLALLKFREMKNLQDIKSKRLSTQSGDDFQRKYNEHIEAQYKRAKLATKNLRASVGFGEDTAKWLVEGNAFIRPYALSELLAEFRSIKDSLDTAKVVGNMILQNQILPTIHEFTGKKISDAIDNAWASRTQSNMGNPNSIPRGRNSKHLELLQQMKKITEFDELLIKSTGERFVRSASVEDNVSYLDNTEGSPLVLPTIMKPMTLLDEHDGLQERSLEEETVSKLKRLNFVEARLNDILSRSKIKNDNDSCSGENANTSTE